MKTLIQENMPNSYQPCWYELGWNKETKSLILRVHKDFIKKTVVLSNNNLINNLTVWSCERKLNPLSLNLDFSGENFGFDNTFKKYEESGDFIEYEIKIPNLGMEVSCDYCSCTGKISFDEPCPICHGSKKKISYDFTPAIAISASFTIFFKLAYWGRNMEITSKNFQLFEIETITERNSVGNGSAVSGWFSGRLTTWLRSLQESSLTDIILAMKIANSQMFNDKSAIFGSFQFGADIGKKGKLILKCPGDASGIYPLSNDRGEDYTFGSCNIDTPVQQITLLAGLAALHDEARKMGV